MRKLLIPVILLALAGCSAPPEQQARDAVIDAIKAAGQEAPGRNQDWFWCENPLGDGLVISFEKLAHWVVDGESVSPINGLAASFTPSLEYESSELLDLDLEAMLKLI